MPFVALRETDGKRVTPSQTTKNDDISCPQCDGQLILYDSFETKNGVFVSSHFKHSSAGGRDSAGGGGGCSGGESDPHIVMKEIAQHRLEWDFDGEIAETFPDNQYIGENMPDAGIRFTEPKNPYGKGILVEVQYRNEGKDIDETTQNYLQQGYSVCWLSEEDFEGKSVDITGNSGLCPVWPNRIPKREGLEGYSEVIQSLLRPSNPSVKVRVQLPSEYFTDHGRKTTIASTGDIEEAHFRLTRDSDKFYFEVVTLNPDSPNFRTTIELTRDDAHMMTSFAVQIDSIEENELLAKKVTPNYEDVVKEWFENPSESTSWLTLTAKPESSFNDPVFIQFWKKERGITERVSIPFHSSYTTGLQDMAKELNRAFEVEFGRKSILDFVYLSKCSFCGVLYPNKGDLGEMDFRNESVVIDINLCSDCHLKIDKRSKESFEDNCIICGNDQRNNFGPRGDPDNVATYPGCRDCRLKVKSEHEFVFRAS